jgi:hypothetical protein
MAEYVQPVAGHIGVIGKTVEHTDQDIAGAATL